MTTVSRPAVAACLLAAALAAGCASAPSKGLHATPPSLGRLPYADADVDFMAGMIPHHAQAVLIKAYGAAQDETVFKFANDVQADQSIEIDVMNKMLEGGSRRPE